MCLLTCTDVQKVSWYKSGWTLHLFTQTLLIFTAVVTKSHRRRPTLTVKPVLYRWPLNSLTWVITTLLPCSRAPWCWNRVKCLSLRSSQPGVSSLSQHNSVGLMLLQATSISTKRAHSSLQPLCSHQHDRVTIQQLEFGTERAKNLRTGEIDYYIHVTWEAN